MSKYFNNGPIGERDYEDNNAQVDTRDGFRLSPVQSRIDAKAVKVASVSTQRFALIAKLTAEFISVNGRRPLRSESDNITSIANKAVGL